MNAPKVEADEYMDFLIATPKACSATEAARVQPDAPRPPAHDAFTRLLTRLEPDPDTLWTEAEPQVRRDDGLLVLDDSTLDKPYARSIAPVTRHGSGKHRAVVRGINSASLLWTDGDRHIPCDDRVYDTADGKTKNGHFAATIRAAKARGFQPRRVAFDGWYSGLGNRKLIRSCEWTWLTRRKSNRLANEDREGTRALTATAISPAGTVVWLPGFGLVRVFGIVAPDGDTTYRATNDRTMTALTRRQFAEFSWAVESDHRGIKPCTGVERCQARSAVAQRNHIGLALRAFLRLEIHCFTAGVSWVEAKTAIIRDAVRKYLEQPRYRLPKPATA